MANIYAKANRVLVWLGEEKSGSADALERIHRAADEFYTFEDWDNKEAELRNAPILTLIERPWFRRVWVSST